MKNRMLASALATVLMCAAAGAQAEGWYSSLTGGVDSVDLSKNMLDTAFTAQMTAPVTARARTLTGYTSSFDDSSSVWGLNVGYQWGKFVAVEVGYVNLGKALYRGSFTSSDGNTATVDPTYGFSARFVNSGPTLAAVGILPLGDRFEVHGRGGILFSKSRFVLPSVVPVDPPLNAATPLTLTTREARERTQDPFVGVGAGWNVNDSFTLRVEYHKYLDVGDNDTGEADIDQISLSAVFR